MGDDGVAERNLKITLAYDGTRYHGFQDQGQDELPTIQRAVETAWHRLFGERVRIVGAGRTDAGVHALGQVASVRTAATGIPVDRVPHAMNSVLASDIRVVGCEAAAPSFHARFDARAKVYRYRVDNGRISSPLERYYSTHVPYPLDVDRMRRAAAWLVGRHDFRALAGSLPEEKNTVRTLLRCEIERAGPIVTFTLEADSFLYHMVRTIVGTLVEVGRGAREPEWVGTLLGSGDRRLAGPTAPAKGLILEAVRYGEESF